MSDSRAGSTVQQNVSLDSEIEILRGLTARTPRGVGLRVPSTVKIEEMDRNDAVLGPSRDYLVSPGCLGLPHGQIDRDYLVSRGGIEGPFYGEDQRDGPE